MTTMTEESHKTMSLLILTLILANVRKRIGPNFLKELIFVDRSDPSVSAVVKAIIRCRR